LPRQKCKTHLEKKKTKEKRTGGLVQVVENLSTKSKALSSNSSKKQTNKQTIHTKQNKKLHWKAALLDQPR
jgi:hypothetical protein